MKKLFLILTATAFLVACGPKNTPQDISQEPEEEMAILDEEVVDQPAPAPKTAAPAPKKTETPAPEVPETRRAVPAEAVKAAPPQETPKEEPKEEPKKDLPVKKGR